MAAPYILAHTFGEAHRFAKDELGLEAGCYRVVNSSGTLKAVRGVELYLVPGWKRRGDRFAMQTAIRYTRMTVIDTEQTPVEAPAPAPEVIGTFGGLNVVQTDGPNMLVDATDFFDGISNGDTMISEGGPAPLEEPDGLKPEGTQLALVPEPEAAPEPEQPKKNRRRSRCKDCGSLHFKEDPCPDGDV